MSKDTRRMMVQREKTKREEKMENLGLYYTMHSNLGIPWWTWLWMIGARGRGKSYAAVDTVLGYQKKYGINNVKCYYFRISDLSIKAILANKGAKAVDAKLVRKYNMDISVKSNRLYNRGKCCMDFYALVSAAKTGKGIAEYDPDFLNNRPKGVKRFIFIIIDEFMLAEDVEKKSVGNPVAQFKIFIENILRDQAQLDYRAVMILGCANAVSECSDFLAQLAGFIPEKPGRYKLKRKHMIIDNIPNSEAYMKKRKESIGADIMDYDEDSNYTNVVKRDLETLKPKNQSLIKVTNIIKFDKDPKRWFTLWDGKIIRKYNGQKYNKNVIISMKRYLDSNYNQELVKNIFQRYDARDFLYADLISQATFAQELKLIKKQ